MCWLAVLHLAANIMLSQMAQAGMTLRFYGNIIGLGDPITGTAVSNLYEDDQFPDSVAAADFASSLQGLFSDFVESSSGRFEWPQPFAAGDSGLNDYGAVATGAFYAPVTGEYRFFIRSDDASAFYFTESPVDLDDLKGDNAPVPDATESDCCDPFTDDETATGTIQLEAGEVRFISLVWKEGGGGDWMQVGMSIDGSPVEVLHLGHVQRYEYTPDAPPQDGLRLAGFGPDGFQSDFEVFAQEGREVSFFVEFDDEFNSAGDAPAVTWSVDGETVVNQKGTMLTFIAGMVHDGSEISASVEGFGEMSMSMIVDPDLENPTVSSVTGNGNPRGILVTFSESVSPETAEDTANYEIEDKSIQSATLIAPNRVILDIGEYDDSPLSISISGIEDTADQANTLEAVTLPVSLSPGLILYLPLDENALDLLGNYDGQETGVFFSKDGERGAVAEFDGNDSHINLGIIDEMQGGVRQFSIGTWFKRSEDRSSDNTNHNVSNVLVAHSYGSANDNFEMGSAGANFESYLDTASLDANLPSVPAGIRNDTWHHALFVYDADAENEVKIYVDGTLIFEDSQYGGVLDDGSALNTTEWTIGLARPDNQLWGDFAGLMDDVAFWSIPLSAEMAAALADGSVNPLSVGSVVTGPLAIDEQPSDVEAPELGSATFNAGISGSDPSVIVVEWYRDGERISGAAGLSLTLSNLSPSDDGAEISYVAYNNNGTFNQVASETAILTVITDTAGPEITGLKAIAGGVNRITVTFDEQLDSASATDPSNFSISGEVAVNAAALQSDGRTVILETGDLIKGESYTVTATGVLDTSEAANASDTSMQVEAIANYFEVVMSDEPVRFYRFSEEPDALTIMDEAVAGGDDEALRTGTVVSGITFQAPSLIFSDQENMAAAFDTQAVAEIDIPIAPDLNSVNGPWSEKTVELWFRADAFPPVGATGPAAAMGLFEQGGNDRALGMFIWRLPEDADPNKARLAFFVFNRLSDGAGSPWFEPANGPEGIYVSHEINLGETYHAVGVMNGSSETDGSISLHVNAEEVDRIGGVGLLYNHTGDVNVGKGDMRLPDNSTGVWTSFDGVIDELALYNSALSQPQIQRHFDAANEGLGDGPAALSSAPQPATVLERQMAGFSATFRGAPPITATWTVGGEEVPGTIEGNRAILSFRTGLDDDGAEIQVTVSNDQGSDSSDPVVLSVTPETDAPQVLSISATAGNVNQVVIVFDEDLDTDTATDTASYSIEGLDITAAALSADGTTVTLNTSQQTAGEEYTVSITGVKDGSAAGNALDASTSVSSYFDYTLAVLSDSPDGYWKFGELDGTTAVNEVNSSWNGTYVAVNAVEPPALGSERLVVGAPDSSVHFANNRVNIPDNAAMNTGGPYNARSIELWFNADTLPRAFDDGTIPEKAVLFESGGTTRGVSIYLFGTETSDTPESADLYLHIWNRGATDGPGAPWGFNPGEPVAVSAAIEAGQTYHVVMVMDGSEEPNEDFTAFLGTLTGYLNGEEVASVPGPGLLYNHGDDAGVGLVRQNVVFHDEVLGSTDGTYPFTGRIDEFAIYNTVLSSETVAFHYEVGTSPVDAINPPSDAAFTGVSTAEGSLTLEWEGTATLQSAESVNGPWEDVTGATSPHTESIDADSRFFRLAP